LRGEIKNMAYGDIDKSKMTVTMKVEDYEYYSDAVLGREALIRILERANKDGKAVMTEELKTTIEEIYC